MAKEPSDWTVIGWQRITVEVPADWSLSGIGGDRLNGHVQIDGPDMPRLWIKWADVTRDRTVDLKARAAEYLKQLRKEARKKKIDFSVEEDLKLLSKRQKRKTSLYCFAWRGDVQAYGTLWYCQECHRVLMAQVTGGLEEEGLKPLAQRILLSLEDHSQAAWDTWGLYGLLCRIPPEFELSGQRLLTGLIELHFEHRQSRITVQRYGLAELVLKEGDLGDWATQQRWKAWRPFRLEREETELHGHPAVLLRGSKKAWVELIRKAVRQLFRVPYPFWLEALVWRCPRTDKIFLLEHLRSYDEESFILSLGEQVQCHRA